MSYKKKQTMWIKLEYDEKYAILIDNLSNKEDCIFLHGYDCISGVGVNPPLTYDILCLLCHLSRYFIMFYCLKDLR